MCYDTIILTKEKGIAIIQLNRPAKLNALNQTLLSELNQVLDNLNNDRDVKVVILYGDHKIFGAGADLKMIATMAPTAVEAHFFFGREAAPVYQKLAGMGKPVIAAISGLALGGVFELALACDIRIASDTATFGLPEVNVGLLPGGGGTQRLPRIIGLTKAKELLFTGETIDAQEAYRLGLLNKVVAPESLLEEAKTMAAKLAIKPAFYAGGMLPVRLLGNTEPIKEAYIHFPTVFCHYARSLMELGLRGDYRLLDGVVSVNMCDTVVHISNGMQTVLNLPNFYFVNRPHDAGIPSAYAFFRQELTKFKEFLEELSGQNITTESLLKAIRLYNQTRNLLQKLNELRGQRDIPLLSGAVVNNIIYVSQVLPPEVNLQLLTSLVEASATQQKPQREKGPRIHVSGSILQDLSFCRMIEECGGMVVSDDLCSGTRFFRNQVSEQGDPLEALTEYYLAQMTCPVMHSKGCEEQKFTDILQMVQENRADGVVFCLQKYCDMHQFESPYLESRLKKAGIPVLCLEVDQGISPEQTRIRLQAFFEMLQS